MKKYIESSDEMEDDGGQLWPIVKKVHIHVPNCAVLRTGVVLVDLPGFGDSNAARHDISGEVIPSVRCTHLQSLIMYNDVA